MEVKRNSIYTGFLITLTVLVSQLIPMDVWAQASQGDLPGEVPFTVVLDAGHGGHDPGNLGNGYLEKNIALSIVLEAGKALEKHGNVKVLYTRDDDTFVNLYKRGEIANKAKADLFVSVHCDSHSSNAHGAGTFVLGLHSNEQNFEVAKKENSVIYLEDNYESRYADYDINSPESVIGLTIMQEEFLDQSILLGKLIQERFTGKLRRKDRKVKQAGFIVLHQTFMPSVLIETGFLTNKEEGKYLNSGKGQQEMGGAIADAILEYHNNIRSNSTSLDPIIPGQAQAVETQPETAEVQPAKTPEDEGATTKEISDSALTSDKLPESSQKPAEEVAAVIPAVAADTDRSKADQAAGDRKPQDEAPVKQIEEPPAKAALKTPAQNADSDIVFKVQLMAVSKDVDLTPSNFKGLNTLSKEPVNNMYRILYGNTPSFEQAEILQAGARQKGFSQAYIVAYRKGQRIPVEEALQYLSN